MMKVALLILVSFFGRPVSHPFIPGGEMLKNGQFEFQFLIPFGFTLGLTEKLNFHVYMLELGSTEGDFIIYRTGGFRFAPVKRDNLSLIFCFSNSYIHWNVDIFTLTSTHLNTYQLEAIYKSNNLTYDGSLILFQDLSANELVPFSSFGVFYKELGISTFQIYFSKRDIFLYVGEIFPKNPKLLWGEVGVFLIPPEELGMGIRFGMFIPKLKS